ncbi:hypothetical protein M8C21_019632 [Ambrosia artemisiifolia]|uniref:tRNA pseudouridine synthase n=1 Tax=Ambrosia artemisiifolia TaxID=4212 RepID=A0AAD5GRV8_AMBAR|nr:hypothetical protein M8C21_019632 [Ambrosia artemisiifolia]
MDNNINNNKFTPQTKDYLHYNHTDSCSSSRWTSRESYLFMYARPWDKVVNFYSNLVNAHTTLHHLFGAKTSHVLDNSVLEGSDESEYVVTPAQKRAGRWARMNFKIILSYHGGSFDGWQKQPGLNTVQEVIEKSLGKFVDERKAGLLKDKGLPLEGNAVVAGRTDKGVTDTWREDVRPEDIEDAINSTLPGKLRVISVSKVPRTFHPNFSAKWRRYMYIFPLNAGETGEEDATIIYDGKTGDQKNSCNDTIIEENIELANDDDKDDTESIKKPTRFEMVRVLVATSIREAAAGADDDALIKLMDATCRRATAPPAPPDGLCLVDVGYNDFDSQTCLII